MPEMNLHPRYAQDKALQLCLHFRFFFYMLAGERDKSMVTSFWHGFHTHQAKCYSCQAWFKSEYELLGVNFDLINITLEQAGYSLDTISVHIVASFEKKKKKR